MRIIDNTQDTDLVQLVRRDTTDASTTVADVLKDVRERGDAAVCDFTRKFDSVDYGTTPKVGTLSQLEKYCEEVAVHQLTYKQKGAIESAVANVSWCAEKSTPRSWSDTAPDGQRVGEVFTPFDRVACYVPQGSFPLVSTVIHTAAIAKAVGVKEIVMVTSPSNEALNPAVAYAALKSGVTEIVYVGGAQGIASVAYGTQTIKKVDFICGPGNQYVAEAKRQLFGSVGIDMVAGPSEVFVVADETADAYAVACDLVAQAEHGSGYEAAVLLTDSAQLIEDVAQQLQKLKDSIVGNPGFLRVWDETLFLVFTPDIATAVSLVNDCAPEHVEIHTVDADIVSQDVTRAGAVFIGGYSAEPLGDFVAGPSHVLPTNSSARFASGLSAASFFRRTSVMEFDGESYNKLAPLAYEFAQMEGLIGHGLSSIARLENNSETRNEKS